MRAVKVFVGVLLILAAGLPGAVAVVEFTNPHQEEFLSGMVSPIAFILFAGGLVLSGEILITKRGFPLHHITRVAILATVMVNIAPLAWTAWFRIHQSALNACVNNLRLIDGAKQQWALANKKTTNDVPTWDEVMPYLTKKPVCPGGGTYTLGRVGQPPTCSLAGPRHNLKYVSHEHEWFGGVMLLLASLTTGLHLFIITRKLT